MSKINIGIIGAGFIANEHIKVIKNINDMKLYGITSRTLKKCVLLKKKYKFTKIYKNFLEMISDKNIDAVIICVSVHNSYKILAEIIPYKKPFFIEKPVGINYLENTKILDLVKKYKTPNMVGFNRRHYSIFHKGLKLLSKNGGIIGFDIEGHERFWQKHKLTKVEKINWHHLNSIHTIDLINFFGGEISKKYVISKKTSLKKNDNINSIFLFKNGIIGSYKSYWHSPGGWKVTLYGDGMTVVFNPLEKGYIINKNFKSKIIAPSQYDKIYKPGFYDQMKSFRDLIINSKIKWPSLNIENAIHSSKLTEYLANE